MKKIFTYSFILFIIFINIAYPSQAISRKYYYDSIIKNCSYTIPKLSTKYIPQGLCKTTYNKKTYRLITAYHYDKTKDSRIYILNSNGKLKKTIYLKNSKGKHVGGITEYNNSLWIVSTKQIYIINKETLFKAKNNSKIKYSTLTSKNIYSEQTTYSCCTSHKGILWIATYDNEKSSKAYGYTYNSKTNSLKHVATMNIPEYCQGIAFYKNYVFFSISHGIFDSTIKKYKISSTSKNGIKTYKLGKKTAEIYSIPSGSEEIYVTSKGNVFVVFESAAKPYIDKFFLISPFYTKENRVVLLDF